ncbi:MAG: PQQ-binding-like beta-propeller repeat protein [Fuerstiella sp.]|nr:PQQ-binding-like beta-propeller repeat protein [Fuerstiella sp.]
MSRWFVTLMICLLLPQSRAADWRQFRGRLTDSVAVGQSLPTELSQSVVAWQSELPGRGLSGPIVVGEQVVITASSGYHDDRLHIISLDTATGSQEWERRFQATGRTSTHPSMCVATPTPASDGERIYAFYSSNDLICTDMQGNLQWYRGLGDEFPNASNSLGMSSSPIVIGTTVIAQAESEAESFVIGVEKSSGETKWILDRPRKSNWSSPAVLPTDGGRSALVLLQSAAGLTAVDPKTGTILWSYQDEASRIPSSTVSDGMIIMPSSSNGLNILQASTDGTSYTLVRSARNARPARPSPLVADGMIYSVNSSGVLSAASLDTGERLWQMRLDGQFSSTPLASNGHLFFFSETGMATVVRPTEETGTIVSQLDLTEKIQCSPAAANHALYVRSDAHLWKFAKRD